MQSLQRLLFNRLNAHRNDFGTASHFEQRTSVSRVGLVALDVGTDVGRRQQAYFNPQTIDQRA